MLSAGLSPDYLHTSLFIPIYHTAVGIISPVEIATEATNFQYKLWENHDLTAQPVTALYLFVWARWYASYLYYFQKCRTVTDQKVN